MQILKNLRKNKHYTQEALADFLECTPTTYGRYEKGTRDHDLATLCKLADFFEVSVDYLLGRETNNLALATTPPEYQRIFESQSPQRQEILFKMLEVLAGMTDTQLENTKGFFSVAFNYNEAKKKKPESL